MEEEIKHHYSEGDLNQLIALAVEPYLRVIEQLKERQREKDAEIVVMRYALAEMDRKVQEIEKKQGSTTKKVGGTATRTSTTRPVVSTIKTKTALAASTVKLNSGVTTPRSTSR